MEGSASDDGIRCEKLVLLFETLQSTTHLSSSQNAKPCAVLNPASGKDTDACPTLFLQRVAGSPKSHPARQEGWKPASIWSESRTALLRCISSRVFSCSRRSTPQLQVSNPLCQLLPVCSDLTARSRPRPAPGAIRHRPGRTWKWPGFASMDG